VIPRSVKVSEAPGYGTTVIDYDPGSRGAMSYLDAGRELATRSPGPGDGMTADTVGKAS
jgi:chromosome partitioning protein